MPYSAYISGEKLTAAKLNERLAGWVRFNGSGVVAINDSYNVSGVTDNGVGDYTVNWITSFASVNYTVAGMAAPGSSGQYLIIEPAILFSSAFRIKLHRRDNGANDDCALVTVLALGDRT